MEFVDDRCTYWTTVAPSYTTIDKFGVTLKKYSIATVNAVKINKKINIIRTIVAGSSSILDNISTLAYRGPVSANISLVF